MSNEQRAEPRCEKCGGVEIGTHFFRMGAEGVQPSGSFNHNDCRFGNIPFGCKAEYGYLTAMRDLLRHNCRTCGWYWTTEPVAPVAVSGDILLPCPFCGSDAAIELSAADSHHARCRKCDARKWGSSRADAIAAWNSRHAPVADSRVVHVYDGAWTCEKCGAYLGAGMIACSGFLLGEEDGGDTRHEEVRAPFYDALRRVADSEAKPDSKLLDFMENAAASLHCNYYAGPECFTVTLHDSVFGGTDRTFHGANVRGAITKAMGIVPDTAAATDCGNCHRCLEGKEEDGMPITSMRMILCPTCGNKRCPKASDCRITCTGSNEAGQPGSVFGGDTAAAKEAP